MDAYPVIDKKKKKCIYNLCQTHPVYNIKGETRGLYCVKHKLSDMVDVRSKKCIHKDCCKYPSFNKEGETSRLYCSDHKLSGMINVKILKTNKTILGKRSLDESDTIVN